MQDEACAGFKHERVNDSPFHIMYIQCGDKAESEPHKLKHVVKKIGFFPQWARSAVVETSSVIQTTVSINFRAESSFLRTRSCVNVMTLPSFPQRDQKQRGTNYSTFDLPGFNLPPDIFTISALFPHIYHPWYLHVLACPRIVPSSLMFLGPVRWCGLYILLSLHICTKNEAKLQEMCFLCCWFICGCSTSDLTMWGKLIFDWFVLIQNLKPHDLLTSIQRFDPYVAFPKRKNICQSKLPPVWSTPQEEFLSFRTLNVMK